MYGAAARHRGSPSDSSDVHNDFGQPLAAITAVLAPEVGLAVAIASDQGDVLAPEFSGPIVLATPPPRRDAVDGGNARKIAKAARTTAAPTSDTDLLVQTSWCPCRRSVGRTDIAPVAAHFGWPSALLVSMGIGLSVAVAITPLRRRLDLERDLSLIHISEPTRLGMISYAVFC